MRLYGQIAQSIVDQTSSVLDLPMSITDETGLIIGCSDKSRIGTHHEATDEVFKAGKAISYTLENVMGRKNVLPGVATPIFFQQKPIGVLGIVGNPENIIKYVYLVRNHVEMLIQETMKAESFSLQLKATEHFIQYLLYQHQFGNKDELLNYCEMMNFDPDIPRACIQIHIPHHVKEATQQQTVKTLEYDLYHLLCKLFKEDSNDIITPINIEQWLILKKVNENPEKMIEKYHDKLTIINQFLKRHQFRCETLIAAGNCYSGIEGIRRSFQQSAKLLAIGKNQKMKKKVLSYQDWFLMTDYLISEINQPFLESIVDIVAGLMNHPNADVLIATFLTYCEQGLNMSKASRELYIHRNTLIYRLNQINEILHIDVNSFEQSMFLYIALKGRKTSK